MQNVTGHWNRERQFPHGDYEQFVGEGKGRRDAWMTLRKIPA
jgi:hypothetical protein